MTNTLYCNFIKFHSRNFVLTSLDLIEFLVKQMNSIIDFFKNNSYTNKKNELGLQRLLYGGDL